MDDSILLTFSMAVRGLSRDEARELVREVRKSMHLNAVSQLERLGADDAAELITLYAPTMSYPLPLTVRGV